MRLTQKKANPPETLAISMLEVFAERYDMSKPEVQKEIASALCDVLRSMSLATGKGATEFLTMYQMTIGSNEKQV